MGGGGSEGGGDGGNGGGNSKARTVEAAIEYIRMLKGEVTELKGRLEVVEKEKEKRGEMGTCLEGTEKNREADEGLGTEESSPMALPTQEETLSNKKTADDGGHANATPRVEETEKSAHLANEAVA